MPGLPPQELVATLERLGLATAGQLAATSRRVERLARGVPQFDSVWIDALAQARLLTPFQAAEFNAGRSAGLHIGPFLLCERIAHACYVASYRAKNIDSGEMVRLAVVENAGPRAEAILAQLRSLVARGYRSDGSIPDLRSSGDSPSPCLPVSPSPPLITDVGRDGDRIFAASRWINGRSAAEWIVHHGRFPPQVVLQIARAMAAELAVLEQSGLCHGDVSTSSLILSEAGEVALAMPGLRAVLRPEEGYAHADLPPEAFDSLAPERIAAGTPPVIASDVYACGCVWWHLLCGRPPLTGGNALAKLRAAQAGGICDVRRYASDAPPPLAAAIAACVEIEPGRRPQSMAALLAMLGPASRDGKDAMSDCLHRAGRPTVHWTTTARTIRRSSRTPLWLAAAVCCVAAVVAIFWPAPQHREPTGPSPRVAASGHNQAASNPHRSPGPVDRPAARLEDNAVLPAAFDEPPQPPPDLVLAAGTPTAEPLSGLCARQRVRASWGHRATLIAPEGGLIVDKEGVRFENIDFVCQPPSANEHTRKAATIVRLLAGRAEFRGCSFRCGPMKHGAPSPPPVVLAIDWVYPARLDPSETSLPNGRIHLADCLFDRVAVGLNCRTAGALGVQLANTLDFAGGPLVRLDHWPRPDEPLSLDLSQVTLRGGGPLLECLAAGGEGQPLEITIRATACVFAPRPGEPLLSCGGIAPKRLLAGLRWSGQGSLVTPPTPMVDWPEAQPRPSFDESALSIAGLVRSDVQFAGGLTSDPAASRVVRWQAPLQSASPPGADPDPLPSPGR